MLKTKSFTLNHELDTRAPEREIIYEPKRICWMKYIVILLLLGFALLLVLSNVDFSGESSASTVRSKGVLTDTSAAARSTFPASFTCTDNRSCKTVVCTGGPIYSVTEEFESEVLKWCDGYFDLIIENCTFYAKTISVYTMKGRYKLNSLTIRNCILETIADNAFNHSTMRNLVNLTIQGVQLQSMNAKSFEGLKTVNHFKLLNMQQNTSTPLKAQNFLQPMAGNLRTLILQQSQEASTHLAIYDPTNWLGGTELFVSLSFVDFSGTHFNHTINSNTFINLMAVKKLSLVNCGLRTIAESTFGGILKTLETLDLRGNQLQTLDGEFLATAATTGVRIHLAGNQWRCECDNSIIEYVKKTEENYNAEEPECALPEEYKGVQVRYIQLSCYETTLLPILNSTMLTTLPTTTITTLSSTPMPTIETTMDMPVPTKSTTASLTTTTLLTTLPIDITPYPISTTTPKSTSHGTSSTETNPLPSIPTTEVISESDETKDTDNPWKSTTTTWKTIPSQQTTIPSTYSTAHTTELRSTTDSTTSTSQIWTSSPTNYTECYSYSSLKLLSCNKTKFINNSNFVLTVPTPLCNYDVIFNAYTTSSTSVQLLIEQSANGLQVTYFQTLTYNNQFTPVKSYSNIDVNDLKPKQNYVFCVIPVGGSTTSPFNCRSVHLSLETAAPWLLKSDRVIFYPITIFITLVCGVVGVAAIYWLLRWRPTLIRGNRRIWRIASTSYEVLLLPKSDKSPFDSQQFALNELRSSINDTFASEKCKSNDYMQYFKSLELSKQTKVTNNSDNRPPLNRAPTLPLEADGRSHGYERPSQSVSINRTISHQFSVLMEGNYEESPRYRKRQNWTIAEESENEYESLDYYQELF